MSCSSVELKRGRRPFLKLNAHSWTAVLGFRRLAVFSVFIGSGCCFMGSEESLCFQCLSGQGVAFCGSEEPMFSVFIGSGCCFQVAFQLSLSNCGAR